MLTILSKAFRFDIHWLPHLCFYKVNIDHLNFLTLYLTKGTFSSPIIFYFIFIFQINNILYASKMTSSAQYGRVKEMIRDEST